MELDKIILLGIYLETIGPRITRDMLKKTIRERITLLNIRTYFETIVDVCESRSVCVWLFATPWPSLGQNTGVGSLSLLQAIFPPQGSDPGLLHCRWIISWARTVQFICGPVWRDWPRRQNREIRNRSMQCGTLVNYRAHISSTDRERGLIN